MNISTKFQLMSSEEMILYFIYLFLFFFFFFEK